MSLKNTYYEVAVAKAKKQTLVVDSLLEESPILAGIPMEASSDGLFNTYEEQTEVTGADLVDLDGILPEINSTSALKQIGLSPIGGKIKVGVDKARAYPGGVEAYFASKLRPVMTATGNGLEKAIFYNSFRAFAATNNKLIDAGGSGATNYSMVCVRYAPQQINGLFDPNGFGNGKMFEILPINDGKMYEDADGRLIFGTAIKSYFGMQLANERYVSGIVNNDIVNDAPAGVRTFATPDMVDQMILNARGGANTVIYMHPAALTKLNQYKSDKLTMTPGDNAYNSMLASWNGIPIITSWNLLAGTEAKVTV